MEYKKQFIILGNINAVTYKEFFPLIKQGRVWAGYSFNKTFEFIMPDSYELKGKAYIDADGKKHGFVPAIAWYTNLDIPKRHEPLIMVKRYDPEMYPHYDNYDAINCDKVADIPMDYFESWGVTHADYALLNAAEWEITREDAERKWIIPASGALRQALSEHSEGYREIIEAALTGALYCNGEVGVPITVCDGLNPKQFDIIGNGGSYKGEGSVADALYVTHTHTHTHTHRTPESLQANHLTPTSGVSIAPASLESPLHSSTNSATNNLQLSGKQSAIPELLHQPILSESCAILNTQKTEEDAPSLITKECMDASLFEYCHGVIGVPITFLDSYSIEQFTIVGYGSGSFGISIGVTGYKDEWKPLLGNTAPVAGNLYYVINGQPVTPYKRILIQRKV
jgi:hypothetical protein